MILCSCSYTAPVVITGADSALNKLKEASESDEFWVRVHALEFLQQLGYFDWVHSSFWQLYNEHGNIPEERIGVWRIGVRLGNTSSEKKEYLEKIKNAYMDPEGPDRLHAAETLAKLGVPLKSLSLERVEQDLNSEGPIRFYVLWGSSISAEENEKSEIEAILIGCKYSDNEGQEILSYALTKMRFEISGEDQLTLEGLVQDATLSSLTKSRLQLVLMLYDIGENRLEDRLEIYHDMLYSNEKNIRYETCEAMASSGDASVLVDLKSIISGHDLMKGEEDSSVLDAWNLDCQSAASFALLSINRKAKSYLSVLDWIVIAMFLFLMIGIGIYYSRRAVNKEDYLLGGRSMNSFMVGLSLFATLLSTLSYLAYPGEMMKYGPMVFFGILSFPVAYWIVGRYIIPRFMEMKITSAYEVLELKLGPQTRNLGTIFFLLLRFLWMSTIIYATVNTALAHIMGFSDKLVPLVCLLIALVTVLYTTLGGIKAVVLTDAIQSFILFGGAVLAIIIISIKFGNSWDWWPTEWVPHWEKLNWGIDFKQRMTIGNIFIMTLVWQVCTAGSDQMAIQRYLSTGSVLKAKKSLKVSLISSGLVQLVLAVLGLAVASYFIRFPEYLAVGTSVYGNADSLFPRFVLIGLPTGVTGLVVAGIMAAAMSSLSSGLNSSSSVLSEDVLDRHFPFLLRINDPLKKVRLITVILGIIVAVCSTFVGYIEGNLLDVVIKVVNLVVAPLFVLFFMALFVPRATDMGTFIGGLISLIIAILISFTGLFGLSVLSIMPVALIVGVVSSYLFSLLDVLTPK